MREQAPVASHLQRSNDSAESCIYTSRLHPHNNVTPHQEGQFASLADCKVNRTVSPPQKRCSVWRGRRNKPGKHPFSTNISSFFCSKQIAVVTSVQRSSAKNVRHPVLSEQRWCRHHTAGDQQWEANRCKRSDRHRLHQKQLMRQKEPLHITGLLWRSRSSPAGLAAADPFHPENLDAAFHLYSPGRSALRGFHLGHACRRSNTSADGAASKRPDVYLVEAQRQDERLDVL